MSKQRTVGPRGQRPSNLKHKYVYAWGRYMDSKDYYIQDQLEAAEKDNAPENAIFKGKDGMWVTTDAIEDPNLAASLADYVKFIK